MDGASISVRETWWSRPAGGREALKIALPMVVTTLSWTMMNFIDSAILMEVSEKAMAAAYTAGVIWFAALSLLFGLCSYGSTFVAQYFGDGQPKKIGPAAWQGVWLRLSFILVVPLAQWLAPQIFHAFKHEAELAAMEALFFQTLCYGAPGMLAAQSLETFYSGRGKSWVVMLVDAWAVLVNLVLACVLVLGWGGVASWGVAGAAWATVVAQWCRVVVYASLMLMPANRKNFATDQFAPRWQMMRRLIRFGGPSGVQMMLDVGGFAIFVLLVNELGIAEAAATSVAFRISQFAFMPVWGFGMATAVLVGQKLGEDRPNLAERATHTALTLCVAYMGTISLLFVLVPRMFLLVFFKQSDDASANGAQLAAVEVMAVHLMRFVAAYNLLDACIIIFVSVLRGAGDTRFVMKVSMFMATSLAAGTWLGVTQLGWNIYAAWWYITIWLWLVAGIYYLRYRAGHWKNMRVIDQVHGQLPQMIAVEPSSSS